MLLYLSFFSLTHTTPHSIIFFFFFNDTATTEIYTLSLHDALPILWNSGPGRGAKRSKGPQIFGGSCMPQDRKSTRLNSSHGYISYAVFCLKKKKKKKEKSGRHKKDARQ